MKIAIIFLVFSLIMTLVLPCTAIAGSSGKVIVPYWQKASNMKSVVSVSNISNSSVDVTISLFDENGNIYNESSESGTNLWVFWGLSSSPLDTPVALASHKTGQLIIDKVGSSKGGYAIVQWSSTSNEAVALITTIQYYAYNSASDFGSIVIIPLNNGMPF
ncbi:MAG: hypothetical protein FJ264_01975 [Planctomycetes bacterium]|nr:hypothetical protein [Planctomycetota bacterium]